MILRPLYLVLISLLSLSALCTYECLHDTYKITYATYPNHDSSTIYLSNSTTRESIRITPVSYISSAPSNVLTMVQDQLIPAVIAYYHATLKVKRLLEPIRLANDDTKYCASVSSTTALRAGIYTDLVILITGRYDYTNQYVAYGFPCYGDATNNRPVVGVLAINYAFGFDKDTDYNYQQNLYILLHQFAHILGFSDTLFPYFINPDTNKVLSTPSKTKTVNGVKIKMLTLGPLTEKLQDYFKCSTLKGAYLEQQGDSGNIGSHFERRIFMNDLMTASTITDMRVSEFLLAFFEGTGWYTPDYKMAEPMFWGKGQGCDFLDTPCLDSNGETSFPDFFCTNTGEDGCSYTNGGYAICGTNDMSVTDSSLNSNFDYFGGNVVMRDRFADNCPYYVNYLDGNCGDESNEDINLEGSEYFGSKSSCFTGTLGENKAKSQKSSYCFKKTCKSIGYGEYKVQITVGKETVTCYKEGAVSVSGYKGKINCPDPKEFCKVTAGAYCPRGCMGRGDCIQNTCLCYDGYDGIDCGYINPDATYPVIITATTESSSPKVVLIVVPIIGVSGLGVGFGYVLYRIAQRRKSLKVVPVNGKKPHKPEVSQTESALDAPSLGHQSSLAPLNMNGSVLSGTTMTGSQLNGSTMQNSALTVGRNISSQPFNLTQEGSITQRIAFRSPKGKNLS